MRLFVILLLVTSVCAAAELKFVGESGVTNVYLVATNQTVRLTNFRNRHHIYAAALSPSERFAFVWHMDFPPRKVMVVDVPTRRTVTDFMLGVAGELEWSADDRIIHRYGLGTARHASIYNTLGDDVFSTGPSFELFEKCDVAVDPSRRALVLLPNLRTAPGQIIFVRTFDGAVRKLGPERITCTDWSWRGPTLQLAYTTSGLEDATPRRMEIPLPEEWLAHKEQ